MVDVDRRISTPGLTPSHAAGLRRLSTRAASSTSSTSSARTAAASSSSITAVALKISSQLSSASIPLSSPLTPGELHRIESSFAFTFPPDLRALLSLSLPSSPGFPNWRLLPSLRPLLDLPIAAVSLLISRSPSSSSAAALRRARLSLRRAPLLLPVFHRCYIPSLPNLAGNPVFFIDDRSISLCALDLPDFFSRLLGSSLRSNSLPRAAAAASARTPRWIEFWSDAAACDRRRRSSASTSEPERFVEIRMARRARARAPEWVSGYLDGIGAALKRGGWGEIEVREMVDAAAPPDLEAEIVDGQAVLDALLLKADRCSDSLRRAGWSSEEVTDVLGFDFRLESERRKKRAEVRLPEEIRVKIGKLAEAVSRS